MRKEYDFSKREHGKFYRPGVELNLPIYLEPDVAKFLHELAKAKNMAVESIVNDWLRQDIALIRRTYYRAKSQLTIDITRCPNLGFSLGGVACEDGFVLGLLPVLAKSVDRRWSACIPNLAIKWSCCRGVDYVWSLFKE